MDEEAGELQGKLVCRWNPAGGREEERIPNEVEFEEESPVKEQQPISPVRPFEWACNRPKWPKLLLYGPYWKYNKQFVFRSQQTVGPVLPGWSSSTYDWQQVYGTNDVYRTRCCTFRCSTFTRAIIGRGDKCYSWMRS
jgi:hypothetical protein